MISDLAWFHLDELTTKYFIDRLELFGRQVSALREFVTEVHCEMNKRFK